MIKYVLVQIVLSRGSKQKRINFFTGYDWLQSMNNIHAIEITIFYDMVRFDVVY